MHLEAIDLEKRYGLRRVLTGVSFGAGTGVLAVVGPNGAGKTTLLRILAGILEPTRGRLALDGVDAWQQPEAYRFRVGYKPEDVTVYVKETVVGTLRYFASLKAIPAGLVEDRIAYLLRALGLEGAADRPLATLSRGLRQRFFLAQALLSDPDLLVLDEPARGLDDLGRRELFKWVGELALHRIVVISGHVLDELADVAGRFLVLSRGTVRFLGSGSHLAAQAAGRVWELSLAAGDPVFHHLSRRHTITAVREEPGPGTRRIVRLLADRRPHPDAVPAQPTVEEGYLACLQLSLPGAPTTVVPTGLR